MVVLLCRTLVFELCINRGNKDDIKTDNYFIIENNAKDLQKLCIDILVTMTKILSSNSLLKT